MPISILTNTIAIPDRAKKVQKAVLAGIGRCPESENWTVRIFEPQASPEYVVKIGGPNDAKWNLTFFGPEEQSPEFIRNAVARATHLTI